MEDAHDDMRAVCFFRGLLPPLPIITAIFGSTLTDP